MFYPTTFCDQLESLRHDISEMQLAFATVPKQGKEATDRERTAVLPRLTALLVKFNQQMAVANMAEADILGRELQCAMLPFVLTARTAGRCYRKPHGYAGDYLSIQQIYENAPDGDGLAGALTDAWFLAQPAAVAVRNRRSLMTGLIQTRISTIGSGPIRIASLACGPACELFDLHFLDDDTRRIHVTLVDFDPRAIAAANLLIEANGLHEMVTCMMTNLALVAVGRVKLALQQQHLIYSVGLIDYFTDDLVIGLLDAIHESLAPGGQAVIGNFHRDNPSKWLMDYVLEWKLIHRSEDDMRRLFGSSKFGDAPVVIRYENERINMFAECWRR